jgi:hypothetical protein
MRATPRRLLPGARSTVPMSTQTSAVRVRATYELIKAHRHQYIAQAMCRVFEVALTGYDDWRSARLPF